MLPSPQEHLEVVVNFLGEVKVFWGGFVVVITFGEVQLHFSLWDIGFQDLESAVLPGIVIVWNWVECRFI